MISLLVGLVLTLSAPARADLPMPDYTEETVVEAWYVLDRQIYDACKWVTPPGSPVEQPVQCSPERLEQVITNARHLQEAVGQDARLLFQVSRAHRLSNAPKSASEVLRQALDLDTSRVEIWTAYGEVSLDLGNYGEARRAMTAVTHLLPYGDGAWYAHFQLAQVAAFEGNALKMEEGLREALRLGFSFALLKGDPTWREFYKNPALTESLERLITVRSTQDVLDSLK